MCVSEASICTTIIKYETSITRTISSANDGTKTYYVYYIDAAGNKSDQSEAKILLDQTAPSCVATKSNTNTTTGVTVKVTGNDGALGSGIASGNVTEENIKATKTYTVTDKVGLTGTCTVEVTAENQTRKSTCSTYKSCQNAACGYNTCQNEAACGCALYGNYGTPTYTVNSVCHASGSKGSTATYVICGRTAEWRCNCRSNPQPNCTWTITARACWYTNIYGGECHDSCGTACSRNNNPGWLGCGNWYGNDEWNGVLKEEKYVYKGSCVSIKSCATSACGYNICRTSACGCETFGSWSVWSTGTCSPNDLTKCESRTIYY